jgi:dihydrodipicolinate synthase/N-acetylneuraminate lyase
MISGPDEMNVAAMVMGSGGAIGSTYNVMYGARFFDRICARGCH